MVIFIDMLVVIVAILLVIAVITQLLEPVCSGEPLFPFFRKSTVKDEIAKTQHELEELAQYTHLQDLLSQVNRRKAESEKKE